MRIVIVTPAYNVRPFIGTALASVVAQSYQDWTLVVVDDGSTDGTAEVAATVADSRLSVIRQPNAGVSAARNRGLAEARGDAVLFLDADDWLAPDALARLAAALDGSGAVASYGPFCFTTEDGGTVVRTKAGPFPRGDIVERLLEENLFANGGHLLIRRPAIDAAGGFRSDLVYGEDWEYWCRIALRGEVDVVAGTAPLLFVRQRSTGAYLRMATDAASFTPCMDAIFGNPALRARFDDGKLAGIRRRTEAENAWIIGRELIRHGRGGEGRAMLLRSVLRKPSAKRAGLLLAAHAPVFLVPEQLRGPFRRYGAG